MDRQEDITHKMVLPREEPPHTEASMLLCTDTIDSFLFSLANCLGLTCFNSYLTTDTTIEGVEDKVLPGCLGNLTLSNISAVHLM